MRIIALVVALMCASTVASAQIPDVISYQGLLEDSLGVAVPNGDYQITFRLYRFPNDQTILHEETVLLGVYAGRFSHYIGSAVALTPGLFDGPLWLGIAIDGGPSLVPRIQLGAVPFAWHAVKAQFAESAPPPVIDLAGGASAARNTLLALGTSSYQTILSESIAVPHAGLVLVIASCELQATGFADINCELGVSASSTSLPNNLDIDVILDSGTISSQSLPVTVHGLFEVPSAGSYTYYFIGKELTNGLDNNATNAQMTLVFLPSTYGAVAPLAMPQTDR